MTLIERFIFFPDPILVGTPAEVSLEYEDAWFDAPDGVRLHGWYVPGSGSTTLLWFHGNAGNISHRLDHARLLHDHVGASLLMFDYRQFGRSAGTATERGVYADARGALAYLRSRPDAGDHLIYLGQSLGSAVAVDLATTDPPRGLILEAAFESLSAMAQTILPGPLARALPSAFDSMRKIPTVAAPVLFIHGEHDEVVPFEQGRRLFAAARPPKSFFTVRGAGHNDPYLVGGDAYFRHIRNFIDGLP